MVTDFGRGRRDALLFWAVMAVAAFMLFGWLGIADVNEWDEARNGANAWEMLRRGDPVNLWYAGEPDTWNAKPPLNIWLIAVSYKLFGYNEWALRLPSAICGLLFFAVFFRIVRRMSDATVAAISCGILFCCKAVISHHVFRTGDFDGPLVLFVTSAIYFFLRFLEGGKGWTALATGTALGFAYWTKGPVAFILLPGMLGYAALRGELRPLLRSRTTWLGFAVAAAMVGGWFVVVARWGVDAQSSFYGTENSVETTFIHDVWRRITEKNFSGEWDHNPAFFLLNLEARMNLWHLAFYLGAAVAIFRIWQQRIRLLPFVRQHENRLALLCVCLTLPVALLLTIAQGAHDWYTAPVLPWMAVLIAIFVRWTVERWQPVRWIWVGVALFTGGRHLYYLATPRQQLKGVFDSRELSRDRDTLLLTSPPRQHVYLYTLWRAQTTAIIDTDELKQHPGKLALLDRHNAASVGDISLDTLSISDDFVAVQIRTTRRD